MKRCTKCEDKGRLYDLACNGGRNGGTCAHGPRIETKYQVLSPRNTTNYATETKIHKAMERVMPCPNRPCSCSLGDPYRRGLRNRARAAAVKFAESERQRGSR